MTLKGRDFLSVDDLSPEEVRFVLDTAVDLKRRSKAGERPPLLAGRVLGMIFEKPSLRTRVTFETGMWELGGHAIYLGLRTSNWACGKACRMLPETWSDGSRGSWLGPSRIVPCSCWPSMRLFL